VPRIEEHIDIAANQPDVFRFAHNLDRRPEWDEGVSRVELLSPPPIRIGTLLRVDAASGGSVFTWDGEVVAYQFPSRSRIRVIDAASTSPFARDSQLTWELSSAGGGTRFTWTWEYQTRGIVARIRDALGGRASAQRSIRESLGNLKEVLEKRRYGAR
jgi:hypothetical protein